MTANTTGGLGSPVALTILSTSIFAALLTGILVGYSCRYINLFCCKWMNKRAQKQRDEEKGKSLQLLETALEDIPGMPADISKSQVLTCKRLEVPDASYVSLVVLRNSGDESGDAEQGTGSRAKGDRKKLGHAPPPPKDSPPDGEGYLDPLGRQDQSMYHEIKIKGQQTKDSSSEGSSPGGYRALDKPEGVVSGPYQELAVTKGRQDEAHIYAAMETEDPKQGRRGKHAVGAPSKTPRKPQKEYLELTA